MENILGASFSIGAGAGSRSIQTQLMAKSVISILPDTKNPPFKRPLFSVIDRIA